MIRVHKNAGDQAGENGRKRLDKGFTLIELLIVMIILGLLAALVAPKMFQKVGSSKQKAAKAQIAMLGTALDAFRLDVGRYPNAQEGLDALRKNPGNDNWDGPYLPKDVPPDPWGKQYVYRFPGEHGDYDLYSMGADGQDGGEGENADVVSWE
ncbi:type II secretion system major pseudopilin GspG [Desulfoferrobacter suflitae]|uniref:type II secretion system major pseudopilin GspG n=1 Tax=Desulfoferrobacter suflitae TaxID=2865782 RepID=UPI0021646946|nr:type II secretion system major pseudopilin GspG [Desulfoferrobacter suflitae]MCK8600238.1 type II secretion system major pseudopilin GspG [Desulfoferrobacter suflitae]